MGLEINYVHVQLGESHVMPGKQMSSCFLLVSILHVNTYFIIPYEYLMEHDKCKFHTREL